MYSFTMRSWVLAIDLLFDPAFRKIKARSDARREPCLCLMELAVNALFDLGLNILCGPSCPLR